MRTRSLPVAALAALIPALACATPLPASRGAAESFARVAVVDADAPGWAPEAPSSAGAPAPSAAGAPAPTSAGAAARTSPDAAAREAMAAARMPSAAPDATAPGATLPLTALDETHDGDWTFALTPYIWAISQRGELEVRGVETDVDLDFGDILDNTDLGLLLNAEARHGDTIVRLDQNYLNLSNDASAGALEVEADLEVYFATLKLGHVVGHDPDAPVVLFVGARYWNIDTELDVEAGGTTIASPGGSRDWVDPLVGVDATWMLDERWSLTAGGDIGGFGIGTASDSTWQAALLASRRMDNGDEILFGWRHLSVENDRGSGSDRWEFDQRITGPLVGWKFRF